MRQVSVQGGKLPVWTRPGSSTTLVFLHYWGGSHRTFASVIDRLSSGCAVVSYDHRGWGAARGLPGPYGIDELAGDVLDVARELGLGRYVLVGHSMGGKTSQLVASRRPDGLAALALIAPAPPRPAVGAEEAEALSHAYDSRATVIDSLEHVLAHQKLPSELREGVVHDSLDSGREARLAWPRRGITQDITAEVRAVDVPVLVIAGRHDQVDPPASLEVNLLPFIPQARMTILEDTGHLSPLEVPELVARHLDELVNGLPVG